MLFIKLSEIKSVECLSSIEEDEIDGCLFNTYKDCKYFTYLHASQLVKAINGLNDDRINSTLAAVSEQL